jgi:hypothetical protein
VAIVLTFDAKISWHGYGRVNFYGPTGTKMTVVDNFCTAICGAE